jgi:arylsulfatase A-like enzyme/Flp pilus assembly protein TadD
MQKNRFLYIILFLFAFLCLSFPLSFLYPENDPTESRLNVLLVTIDTLRADRLGCYSREHLETPNIDRLAEKGTIFTKAFAHASTTLPAHVSILLGTVPLYHGVHDNGTFRVEDRFLTLAEHLKSHGYSTGAYIGAYPLDSRFGLAQGFDVYDEDYRGKSTQKLSFIERKAGDVADRATEWLEKQEARWFLWVHCFDPHDPYDPPEPFQTQYKDRLYDGEVAYVDSSLEKLFSHMRNNGLMDDTVVVITGDHGESLGEHGEMTHGYYAYNSTIWIPLIISVPGVSGGRNTQTVCHADIFPTLCDILKIETPPVLQGVSLLPAMRGKTLPERPIYFESMYPYYSRGWAPLKGFISGNSKFIESPIPELYDLEKDFHELQNLAATVKLEDYRKELARIMEEQSLPGGEEERRPQADRETLEKLKSLGYISTRRTSENKDFGPQDDVKTILPFHNKSMEAMDLCRTGKVDEGIRLLREVITEREDVDIAYTNLATVFKDMGKLNEALLVLDQGMQSIPSSYEIFITYMNFLLDAGRDDDAIELFTGMNLRQMEHDPEAWNFLGAAYSRKGNFEKALEAYEMALSLDNKYSVAHKNIGAVHFSVFLKTKERSSFQKALQNFKKAIEINPDHASAYNGLGGAYLYAGNLEGAIYCLEKALELDPHLPNALYNLGLAHLQRGEKAKAFWYLIQYKDRYERFLSPSGKKKLEELFLKCK